MGRTLLLALAPMMLLGITACACLPSHAAPEPAPQVHIRLQEPTTQEAQIAESASSCIEFWGAVHLDRRPADVVVVLLDVEADTGWSCKIAPAAFNVSDTILHPFKFNVTVPSGSPAAIDGHLNVTATAKGKAFTSSDRAMANVTVAPYFKVQFETEEPYIEIPPGGAAEFKLRIFNLGNTVDSFEIDLQNARQLSAGGWAVQFDKNPIPNVPVNEAADLTVRASSPQVWNMDLWISRPTQIEIKATSTGAKEHESVVTQTFPLYAYERGFNLPLLGMITASIMLAAVAVAILVWVRRRRRKNTGRRLRK